MGDFYELFFADAEAAAAALEESCARDALALELAQDVGALEQAMTALLAALQAHFAAHPLPQRAAVRSGAGIEAQVALAELRALLSSFSGKSLTYFDSVRADLAGVLDEATLARVGELIRAFEFEQAQGLLPA